MFEFSGMDVTATRPKVADTSPEAVALRKRTYEQRVASGEIHQTSTKEPIRGPRGEILPQTDSAELLKTMSAVTLNPLYGVFAAPEGFKAGVEEIGAGTRTFGRSFETPEKRMLNAQEGESSGAIAGAGQVAGGALKVGMAAGAPVIPASGTVGLGFATLAPATHLVQATGSKAAEKATQIVLQPVTSLFKPTTEAGKSWAEIGDFLTTILVLKGIKSGVAKAIGRRASANQSTVADRNIINSRVTPEEFARGLGIKETDIGLTEPSPKSPVDIRLMADESRQIPERTTSFVAGEEGIRAIVPERPDTFIEGQLPQQLSREQLKASRANIRAKNKGRFDDILDEETQPPVGPTGEPAQQTPSKAVEPTTLPPPTSTEGIVAPQKPVEPLKPAEPTQTTTEGQPTPITQPEKIPTTPASEFYKAKIGKEPPDQSVVPEQYRDKVVFTGSDKGRDGVPLNYRFQDITNRADFQVSDLKDFESEYKKVEGVPKEGAQSPEATVDPTHTIAPKTVSDVSQNPPQPLTPSKLQEAKEAAPKAGMTQKEMKKTLIGELQKAKAIVDPIVARVQEDLGMRESLGDMIRERNRIDNLMNKTRKQRYKMDELSKSIKEVGDELAKRVANLSEDQIEQAGLTLDANHKLIVDIPGDGSFSTPLHMIDEYMSRVEKRFPTTVERPPSFLRNETKFPKGNAKAPKTETPSFTKPELDEIFKPFKGIVGGLEEAKAAAGITKSDFPVAETPENIQLRQAIQFIEKNPKLNPFKADTPLSTIIPGISQKQMEKLGDKIAGAFKSAFAEIENQKKLGTLKSDKVKDYLVSNIPEDATPKERQAAVELARKAQVQIRREEVAQRVAARRYQLSIEASDRIINKSLPQELQKKILETANQFRVSTDTQGRFTAGFKSRVAAMADSYGAAGGELANRMYMGDIARSHFMERGYDVVGKIRDIYDEVSPIKQQAISNAVINALEHRDQAKIFLDTPEKQKVYDLAVGLLDEFKGELKKRGYQTRENYFTHIEDVDVLEQVLDGISDSRKEKVQNLNSFITDKSKFLKPRTADEIEINKNLPMVLSTYVRSVSKELAYKDAVEYYYTEFQKDIPPALKSNGMGRAMQLMESSLNPEKGRGAFFRTANWIRNQQYRNFLGMNLKASVQNLTQVDFAKMRWMPEADKLRQKIWSNRIELSGALADAIEVASADTPRFLEMMKEPGQEVTKSTISEKFNKIDTFQKSEGRNWRQTELGSILNSVMNDPRYKEMEAKYGGDQIKAVSKMLEDKEVFDKAVRSAAVTSAETQVAAAPSMRGEFYDTPLHRLIGMFTAFKTRQLQIFGQALGRQEGINGARAKLILRRGMSGDVAPVEVLREVETTRKAIENMLESAKKHNDDIGIPRQTVREYADYLKRQERELNDIIKQIEPAGGSASRRASLIAKYLGKTALISMSFSMLWDFVDSSVYGDEDKEKNMIANALKKAVVDVWPAPFYGSNPSKFLVSPVAPNFENAQPFGNFSGRGLARDIFSYSLNAVPFGGLIDRATGKRISKAAIDYIVPKKVTPKKAVVF